MAVGEQTIGEADAVREYIGLAYWMANHMVPQRDADDAVQDALIAFVVAHRAFRPELNDDYHGWVTVAMRRRIIDGQRRRTNYNKAEHRRPPASSSFDHVVTTYVDGDVTTLGDVLVDGQGDVDLEVVADDFADYLRTLFDDPADRLIIDGLLDGRTQADMGAELGVTDSRVSQRVVAIRARCARAVYRANR